MLRTVWDGHRFRGTSPTRTSRHAAIKSRSSPDLPAQPLDLVSLVTSPQNVGDPWWSVLVFSSTCLSSPSHLPLLISLYHCQSQKSSPESTELRALFRYVSLPELSSKDSKPAGDNRQTHLSLPSACSLHLVNQSPDHCISEMALGIDTMSPFKPHILAFLPFKTVVFMYIFDGCGVYFHFCTWKRANFTQTRASVS